MKRKKRIYHSRPRRVEEGLAWFNGHETPTREDADEAMAILHDEYMSIVRW
jgi:hypothetical protein